MSENAIRLTQYSHGAGCGCKISPAVLDNILGEAGKGHAFKELLVGNDSRDDAAVYQIDEQRAIISTTDFFMPIVDDPETFGRIAATNAISDIYAMGGRPLMAIAIFGWPINLLPESVAGQVIRGGRLACEEAGIPLAGGHSIDAPEPIFGLAVTGEVAVKGLKRNDQANDGDKLYLTKPLGIGILTTAEKKGILQAEHQGLAAQTMCQLNKVGTEVAEIAEVSAMTDVTGFGLLGHLNEICSGSGLQARVYASQVPLLDGVSDYLDAGSIPGGTGRNFASYGQHLAVSERYQKLFCDPQTSGGLLIAVSPEGAPKLEACLKAAGCHAQPIGEITRERLGSRIMVIED